MAKETYEEIRSWNYGNLRAALGTCLLSTVGREPAAHTLKMLVGVPGMTSG